MIDQMNKSEIITLKKEYISVDGSFGGNQRWLRKYEDKANTLSDYGCGLISANDVLLHISDQPGNPSKEKYIAAVHDMNRRYFHVLPFLGVSGIMLSFYMRIYLFMHRKHFNKRYKVHWGVMPRNLLKRITEMLKNDIPVVLSIGPGLIRGRKAELSLYSIKASNLSSEINSPNSNIEKSAPEITKVNSVKDHYVNVTGLYNYEAKHEGNLRNKSSKSGFITMLEISSWGKKYYIDFDEYKDYVRKHDNFLFSNILYIKPR